MRLLRLKGKQRIKDIKYMPQEMFNLLKIGKMTKEIEAIASRPKVSILDVGCLDMAGNKYVVEMQRKIDISPTSERSKEVFLKRIQFYAAVLYGGSMARGSKYADLIFN